MKVAICFSGIPREGYLENIEQFKKIFDITDRPEFECLDFFFSTYNQYELPFEHMTFPETNKTYLIDKKGVLDVGIDDGVYKIYNMKRRSPTPNEETKELLEKKMVHGYKQILSHALQLVFQVPPDYDIIVRARYDSWLSEHVDWLNYVKTTYEKKIVLGVANITPDLERKPHHGPGFHTLLEMKRKRKTKRKRNWLSDHIIIHQRDFFDPIFAIDLYNRDSLMGTEYGWYQIFEKNVPGRRIRSFVGGMMINYEGCPCPYSKEVFYSYA